MDGKQVEERLAAIEQELDSIVVEISNGEATAETVTRGENLEAEKAQLETTLKGLKFAERRTALQKTENRSSGPSIGPVKTRGGSQRDANNALQAWALVNLAGSDRELTERHKEAMERCGISRHERTFNPSNIVRAQSKGTASEGGNLISGSGFMGLEQHLKDYGDMLNVATVVSTPDGNDKHLGTVDGTSVIARPVAELVEAPEEDYEFNKIPWKAHVYGFTVPNISKQLLTDVEFDFEGWLRPQIAEGHYRGWNLDFISGDGSAKPYGLLDPTTGATEGHETAVSTDFSWQEVRKTIFSVDAAYRRLSGFGIMMHDAIYGKFWDWADDNEVPQFLISIRDSGELRFMGLPLYINNNMPSEVEAGEPILAVGAFSKFIVRQVHGVELTPLVETYIRKYAWGITSHSRVDARLANRNAVKYLKAKA